MSISHSIASLLLTMAGQCYAAIDVRCKLLWRSALSRCTCSRDARRKETPNLHVSQVPHHPSSRSELQLSINQTSSSTSIRSGDIRQNAQPSEIHHLGTLDPYDHLCVLCADDRGCQRPKDHTQGTELCMELPIRHRRLTVHSFAGLLRH